MTHGPAAEEYPSAEGYSSAGGPQGCISPQVLTKAWRPPSERLVCGLFIALVIQVPAGTALGGGGGGGILEGGDNRIRRGRNLGMEMSLAGQSVA